MKNIKRKWWWPFCCGTVIINNNCNCRKKNRPKNKNVFEVNRGKLTKYDPQTKNGIIESKNRQFNLTPETIFVTPVEVGMTVDFTGLRDTGYKNQKTMNTRSQISDTQDSSLDNPVFVLSSTEPPTGQLEPIRTNGPAGGRRSDITIIGDDCAIAAYADLDNNFYYLTIDGEKHIFVSTTGYRDETELTGWFEKMEDPLGNYCQITFEQGGDTFGPFDIYVL